jgi:hypothetical protein
MTTSTNGAFSCAAALGIAIENQPMATLRLQAQHAPTKFDLVLMSTLAEKIFSMQLRPFDERLVTIIRDAGRLTSGIVTIVRPGNSGIGQRHKWFPLASPPSPVSCATFFP